MKTNLFQKIEDEYYVYRDLVSLIDFGFLITNRQGYRILLRDNPEGMLLREWAIDKDWPRLRRLLVRMDTIDIFR